MKYIFKQTFRNKILEHTVYFPKQTF